MEHQLNNPLRPSVKTLRTENSLPEVSPSPAMPPKDTKPPETNTSNEQPSSLRVTTPSPRSSKKVESSTILKPEVRKALDALNASEELRKLMLQLTQSGIEIAGPKKTYIKHSYEIDQELHLRFHEMYPVLGFKKVKDAINDAIAAWCDQNEVEFRRRSGSKK